MLWLWIFLILPAALLAWVLWTGRRHYCIRRPNCCGRGCGCLFPKKRKD